MPYPYLLPSMTATKTKKPTGPEQVADFLDQLEHPLKAEIEEVRKIILAASPQLTEHIKWKAPSFCFNGEDRITFNLHGKGQFRLIFHFGAKAKIAAAQKTLPEDPEKLLTWVAADRAVATFTNMAEVKATEAALTMVVQQWLQI